MKRSDMIEYIAQELEFIGVHVPGWSRESNESYVKRKAQGMLDMIEGFGMSPPERTVKKSRDFGGTIVEWSVEERSWEYE